jgi:outer membrane protein OmpA-like peptidoglycan-associated protein
MAADLKKAEVDALFQEVERLEAAVDVAVENEKTTKEKMETAIISCKVAEEKLKEAAEAASKTSASMSGATEERKKLQGQTAEARTEVAAAREGVRRYGGSGAGTGEEEPPTFDKPAEIVKDDAALAAVSSVSERELGEVRKLARPPQLVRRALELVQVLLKAAEGKNVKVSAPGEEADWAELQTMLSRPDFIKRVLALNALDLSKRTDLLDRVSERWPALKEAVGTTAAPRWKKTDVMNKLGLRNQLVATAAKGGGGAAAAAAAAAAEAGTEGDEEGAMPPTPGGRGGVGLIAAVKAAAAENKADGPALTVEAVEYASRPCGAIFRWCAAVLVAAMSMGRNREAAQAVLDAALTKLNGLSGALAAAEAFAAELGAEDAQLVAASKAAQRNLDLCQGMRMSTGTAHSAAIMALEEARRKAREAFERAKLEDAAFGRLREELERKQKERELKEAEAKLAEAGKLPIKHAPPKPPATDQLCWLHELQMTEVKPLEFQMAATTLPVDAHVSLAKVAKELQRMPSLRLHIAGHAQADEDPKLSAQRAQAVGAALIALGTLPSRLRAKGYGASVSLSSAMKARQGIKTDRRVGVHAIAELGTRYGIEFPARESTITERSHEMLKEVAKLLDEHKALKLSVEGHTDDREYSAAENAKLSVQRAHAVCRALDALGVDVARLVPHGFGATLPLQDNSSEDGRQRNRRVQFLVIPNVNPQQR